MRRSMTCRATAFALVAMALAPAAALGQATETLETGKQAITVDPFTSGGGATVGWWKMKDADTRFGWLVNVNLSHDAQSIGDADNSQTSFVLAVGPEIRNYEGVSGRVAPFVFLGGDVGFELTRQSPAVGDADNDWTARLGARAGLGVEFFLLRNLSIDARIGARAGFDYRPLEGGVDAAEDGSVWGFDLGTFTSGIGAAFYF